MVEVIVKHCNSSIRQLTKSELEHWLSLNHKLMEDIISAFLSAQCRRLTLVSARHTDFRSLPLALPLFSAQCQKLPHRSARYQSNPLNAERSPHVAAQVRAVCRLRTLYRGHPFVSAQFRELPLVSARSTAFRSLPLGSCPSGPPYCWTTILALC